MFRRLWGPALLALWSLVLAVVVGVASASAAIYGDFNLAQIAGTAPTLMTAASTASQGNSGFMGVALALADGANFRVASSISNQNDSATGSLDQSVGLRAYDGSAFPRVRVSTVGTGQLIAAPPDYSYARVTADGQAKGSAGFLHTCTFSATGTVTAGVITIYDSLTEANTVIWSGTIQTGLNPVTITLDVKAGTGIYIGYDGTIANVATTCSYR